MIIWPFIHDHEFVLEADQTIQLTKDFSIGTKLVHQGRAVKMQTDIKVGENFHKQLTYSWEAAIVTIRRKKRLLEVEINGKWKENYYLKTPWIWFPKLK